MSDAIDFDALERRVRGQSTAGDHAPELLRALRVARAAEKLREAFQWRGEYEHALRTLTSAEWTALAAYDAAVKGAG